jgi:hypothetical protein
MAVQSTSRKGDTMKLRLLVVLCALVTVAITATTATAAAPYGLCPASGTSLSGVYKHLTITGNAYVDAGNSLTVKGGLTIAPGACLEAFFASAVMIDGGVSVGQGGIFGLGYGPGTYTVKGGVNADRPGSLYIGGATIDGGLVSNGGGDAGRNFPIKDNTINGGVSVRGWQGLWIGFLRNHVHGNMVIADNTAADPTTDPGSDSTEVADNVVSGNLICTGNTPAAELGDSGGGMNTVSGHAVGECAALAT